MTTLISIWILLFIVNHGKKIKVAESGTQELKKSGKNIYLKTKTMEGGFLSSWVPDSFGMTALQIQLPDIA
jgi:hypothetical protein